jgi:hypothetical protein|tara:strand:+ start:441 stop:776 length:336 start_codon:yes stop_codon:yes gene_type:complete
MKAILIDVKNEEVREVEFDGTLNNIYELVDCATFDVVRIDETNGIYVDDEGLFVEDQLFFTYHGDNYSQTLAGNGLILGVDSEGNSISPTLTVEEVQEAVDFQPRGFDTWH